MSLFNAMKALKVLGNMDTFKEVTIKTPLTTTIEGPANYVSEIPQPHGIPMSMKLYELTEPKGRRAGQRSSRTVIANPELIELKVVGGNRKTSTPSAHIATDSALLGISNLLFMNEEKPSDHAGPDADENWSWKNTEVNLNHLDGDLSRIDSLKEAYLDPCTLFDHEICSINLRKAILYQSKSLVKIIVRSHLIPFLKNPKALPVQRDKSSIINMMDCFKVTPLMVAAKVGNIKIVHVLLQYGADPTYITDAGETALSIGAKHHDEKMIELLIEYGADLGAALCMSGLNRPTVKHEVFSDLRDLNTPNIGFSHYGFSFEPILILSQPRFLLMARNPVLEAFKVGTIIDKIGDKKDEYLGDCEELERQTDDFAYYYLDQCRSMWEALLLLHDQHSEKGDLLEYALLKKKMKFISHHYCQQYIMDMWYGGVQRGRLKNTLKKLFQLFLIHIFMIFIFVHELIQFIVKFDLVNYVGLKNTRPMTIWQNLHVPVLSYVVDFFNFLILIVVLIWTCLSTNEHVYQGPEIWLWMCLAARFMVEMDKLRMQGRHFFKHAGNVVDLSVSCCIILTVFLKLIAETGWYDSSRFSLWTSYIYATAFLGLMLRMLEMLDITYTLGPLEGAISKMMMDVFKVCCLLIICMIGFSVSMWTVTYQSYYYVSNITNTSNTDYYQDPEYPDLFSSFNTTFLNLLWSTFGLIEPENVEIAYNNNADNYLKVLWCIYILTAMVLFLNMLIAMLTETYVKVISNAEIEWKYARSVVVTKYKGTHPFMFPFNLFLYPMFALFHMFHNRIHKHDGMRAPDDADREALRQSGFLHQTIKQRFKRKFADVLSIPYHYRMNIFDYYKVFPFNKKTKRSMFKRSQRRNSLRSSTKPESELVESSSSSDSDMYDNSGGKGDRGPNPTPPEGRSGLESPPPQGAGWSLYRPSQEDGAAPT